MALHCEVIGCQRLAEWKRSPTLVGNFSEYLCEQHYESLSQAHAQLALHYERLPDVVDLERDAGDIRDSSLSPRSKAGSW